jgi:hypothetical protein
MLFLVTSASGGNGDGYGALLAFDLDGRARGVFSDDGRIADPRGLAVDRSQDLLFLNSGADRVLALDRHGRVARDSGPIPGLNPGGACFGPDGRYYLTLRGERTILAMPASLEGAREHLLSPGIVPYPRGFAFGADHRLFLSSGIGPDGMGDNVVLGFSPDDLSKPTCLVSDPGLSPLDLTVAPNGHIVVSSEHPFGSAQAVTGIREYDAADGRLVRVFSAGGSAELRKPRGLRFGPDGTLYCVARDEIVAFDFTSGRCLGPVVRYPRLNGQAVAVFPSRV